MPISAADRVQKFSAVIADKASTEAEKQNATRRLGELLAKHPELLTHTERPPAGHKRSRKTQKSKATSTGAKAPRVSTDDLKKTIGISARDLRRAARVMGKMAGYAGEKKVQMGMAVFIDMLDEWENG